MKRILFILILFVAIAFGQWWITPTNLPYYVSTLEFIKADFDSLTVDSIYHAFGGFQDSSVSIAITQDVWADLTNADEDLFGVYESEGFEKNGDTLMFLHKGDYYGNVKLSFSGTNGNTYKFRVVDISDTTEIGYHGYETATGTNNSTSITLPIYFEVAADSAQYVFQVTNTDAGNDLIARSCVFYINYLHE